MHPNIQSGGSYSAVNIFRARTTSDMIQSASNNQLIIHNLRGAGLSTVEKLPLNFENSDEVELRLPCLVHTHWLKP